MESVPSDALILAETLLYATSSVTVPNHGEAVMTKLHDDGYAAAANFMAEISTESFVRVGNHQVAGWPSIQQTPLWLECERWSGSLSQEDWEAMDECERSEVTRDAQEQWQLLLQIDTDVSAGWMWLDGGTMFFLIRRSDLAAGDFEKAWMTVQT